MDMNFLLANSVDVTESATSFRFDFRDGRQAVYRAEFDGVSTTFRRKVGDTPWIEVSYNTWRSAEQAASILQRRWGRND